MDITFQTNFWVGFPESNSDIILNLTHWQYWWWFWFTYFLCLYYFIFLKLIKKRTLKFNPKITTSHRAHGKWGDFIVCILPISWCTNILSNSNFILRMLEWQSESNLFTVRIRGKQWYWIYKFELKTLLNVNQLPQNYGSNYWVLFSNNNLEYSEDYLNLIQIKHNNDWLDNYTNTILNKKNNIFQNVINNNIWILKNKENKIKLNFKNLLLLKFNLINGSLNNNSNVFQTLNSNFNMFNKFKIFNNYNLLNNLNNIKINSFFTNDINHFYKLNNFNKLQLLIPTILDKKILFSFNVGNNVSIEKNIPDNIYLVIKQKRYNTNKSFISYSNKYLQLKNLNFLKLSTLNSNQLKLLHSTNFNKNSNISNIYSRRLLRTRRILVLPININITLITNSFDVVHSWYIPGLGIKLDCIPGRSTHHTINIDHSGFYYGQCAEICGRFHHHMPIRICALPYEHFLIWWYHYGLPYFTAVNTSRKTYIINNLRQFNW